MTATRRLAATPRDWKEIGTAMYGKSLTISDIFGPTSSTSHSTAIGASASCQGLLKTRGSPTSEKSSALQHSTIRSSPVIGTPSSTSSRLCFFSVLHSKRGALQLSAVSPFRTEPGLARGRFEHFEVPAAGNQRSMPVVAPPLSYTVERRLAAANPKPTSTPLSRETASRPNRGCREK